MYVFTDVIDLNSIGQRLGVVFDLRSTPTSDGYELTAACAKCGLELTPYRYYIQGEEVAHARRNELARRNSEKNIARFAQDRLVWHACAQRCPVPGCIGHSTVTMGGTAVAVHASKDVGQPFMFQPKKMSPSLTRAIDDLFATPPPMYNAPRYATWPGLEAIGEAAAAAGCTPEAPCNACRTAEAIRQERAAARAAAERATILAADFSNFERHQREDYAGGFVYSTAQASTLWSEQVRAKVRASAEAAKERDRNRVVIDLGDDDYAW